MEADIPARGDDGIALGVQAVHHAGQQLQLALHAVGEEVGVDEDRVGRCQGGIVLEEERRGHLRALCKWRGRPKCQSRMSLTQEAGRAYISRTTSSP